MVNPKKNTNKFDVSKLGIRGESFNLCDFPDYFSRHSGQDYGTPIAVMISGFKNHREERAEIVSDLETLVKIVSLKRYFESCHRVVDLGRVLEAIVSRSYELGVIVFTKKGREYKIYVPSVSDVDGDKVLQRFSQPPQDFIIKENDLFSLPIPYNGQNKQLVFKPDDTIRLKKSQQRVVVTIYPGYEFSVIKKMVDLGGMPIGEFSPREGIIFLVDSPKIYSHIKTSKIKGKKQFSLDNSIQGVVQMICSLNNLGPRVVHGEAFKNDREDHENFKTLYFPALPYVNAPDSWYQTKPEVHHKIHRLISSDVETYRPVIEKFRRQLNKKS